MKKLVNCIAGLLMAVSSSALSQETIPQKETWSIKPHMHLRLRYDVQGDEDKDPTAHKMSGGKYKYGPHPSQMFDYRTKVWLDIDSEELGIDSRICLANRMNYYTSDWAEKNNYGTSHHCAPNTLFFNDLYIGFSKLDIDGLSIKLGRQPVRLGNNMIIRDGVPGDWPTYFNGAVVTYNHKPNVLKFIALYDYWRDPLSVNLRWDREDYTSGRGRALNPGNVATLGLYDVHSFNDMFKTDVYYFFNDVEADRNGRKERSMPNDWDDLHMHTFGFRLHGDLLPSLGYSAELAQQLGRWEKGHDSGNQQGNLLDLRLNWKLYEAFGLLPEIKPTLNLSYTYWSGPHKGSSTYHGWYNLQSFYEGLFIEQASNKGGVPCGSLWTNLHAYHASLKFKPMKGLTVDTGSTAYIADEHPAAGRNVGVSIFTRGIYKVNEQLDIQCILSHMFFGDYYGHDHADGGFWGRIEINYKL